MLGDAVLYTGGQVDHGAALEKLYMTPELYPEGAKNPHTEEKKINK